MKADAIRVTPPESLAEARRVVERFVAHYNGDRLHSAIGYVTPDDVLAGRQKAILSLPRFRGHPRYAIVREE